MPERFTDQAQARTRLQARYGSAIRELEQRALVTEHLVDKDVYRILVSTLWVNVVLDPHAAGLEEADLEPLHDVINQHVANVLGTGESLTGCFGYLNSRAGERAMQAARLTPEHRDLLLYFASMILDPEGHRRWTAAISDQPEP
jgi:hypothetical protein